MKSDLALQHDFVTLMTPRREKLGAGLISPDPSARNIAATRPNPRERSGGTIVSGVYPIRGIGWDG